MKTAYLQHFLFIAGVFFSCAEAPAQSPVVFSILNINQVVVSYLSRDYFTPQRIVWTSGDLLVSQLEVLLKKQAGQAFLSPQDSCRIVNKGMADSGMLLGLGATSFWEEFSLDEAANTAPIDDLVPEGKEASLRSMGTACYNSFHRSLQ